MLTSNEEMEVRHFIDLEKNADILTGLLLPFTGLHQLEFGTSKKNVKKVYIGDKPFELYVQLNKLLKDDTHIKDSHSYLSSVYLKFKGDSKERLLYKFSIPEELQNDYKLLLEGRYTEMLESTKKLICTDSILVYNKRTGLFVETDPALECLKANSRLKKNLAIFLGSKISDLPVELITRIKLESKNYILNNL